MKQRLERQQTLVGKTETGEAADLMAQFSLIVMRASQPSDTGRMPPTPHLPPSNTHNISAKLNQLVVKCKNGLGVCVCVGRL